MASSLKSRLILLLMPLLILPLLTSCAGNQTPVKKDGFYFDTVITVTLYGKDKEPLLDGCMDLAARYEDLFSAQKEGTDIYRINHAGGQPVTVSDETVDLLREGLSYGALSHGLFSIVCGSVTDLWDISDKAENYADTSGEKTVAGEKAADADLPGESSFEGGSDAENLSIPTEDEIHEALTHTGDDKIKIDGNEVTLLDPAAAIDPGAVAKGYIADRMKDYLVEKGVQSGIINLGGNVLVIGNRPDGKSYNIGIQKPFSEDGQAAFSLSATDRSIVTSGNYQRYFKVDGKLYHHIIDLSTGYPADTGLSSVTIVSDMSVDGDALSTICFLLGEDEARTLLDSMDGIEAAFIDEKGKVTCTDGLSSSLTLAD